MHYLISVFDDRTRSAPPTKMAAINAFNARPGPMATGS